MIQPPRGNVVQGMGELGCSGVCAIARAAVAAAAWGGSCRGLPRCARRAQLSLHLQEAREHTRCPPSATR